MDHLGETMPSIDLRSLASDIITIAVKIAKTLNKIEKELDEEWKHSRDVINRHISREDKDTLHSLQSQSDFSASLQTGASS